MALAQEVQLQRDGGARDNIGRRVAGSPALRVAGRRLLSAIPVLLLALAAGIIVAVLAARRPNGIRDRISRRSACSGCPPRRS